MAAVEEEGDPASARGPSQRPPTSQARRRDMLSEGGPCFQKHPSHRADLHGEAQPDTLEHGDPGWKRCACWAEDSVRGLSFPLGCTQDTRLCGDSCSSLSAAAPPSPLSIPCGTTLLPDGAPQPPSGALSKGKGCWSTEPPKLSKGEATSSPGVEALGLHGDA